MKTLIFLFCISYIYAGQVTTGEGKTSDEARAKAMSQQNPNNKNFVMKESVKISAGPDGKMQETRQVKIISNYDGPKPNNKTANNHTRSGDTAGRPFKR